MSNKVTTPGYFLKRMKDCGVNADKLQINYTQLDPRAWTIIIDPGLANIFCTCYVNHNVPNNNYFELYDGGQFIPGKFSIKTDSIEVIINYLHKFNIINQSHNSSRQISPNP